MRSRTSRSPRRRFARGERLRPAATSAAAAAARTGLGDEAPAGAAGRCSSPSARASLTLSSALALAPARPPARPPPCRPARPSSALQKQVIDPLTKFVREATSFVAGCSRPDNDFIKVATAVAVGFAVVGGTGYLVKFVHIPITQILIG